MTMLNSLQTIPLLKSSFDSDEMISSIGYDDGIENHYQKILYELRQSVDYEWATLFSLNKQSGKLEVIARAGEGFDFIGTIHFPLGMGLSAWVAQKKKLIYLPDIHRGSRHGHHPIRSFISIPLILHEQVIGVLNLAHIFPNAFGEKEIRTLDFLKHEIATQINNTVDLTLFS